VTYQWVTVDFRAKNFRVPFPGVEGATTRDQLGKAMREAKD
jgi:hypothetical protein